MRVCSTGGRAIALAVAAIVAATAAATGCAGRADRRAAPAASSTTTPAAAGTEPPPTGATTTLPATSTTAGWVVGASTLPRRPDGFGQVLPTPAPLRDRRLQAPDRLPPPADGRFASTIATTSAEQLGATWQPGCPVPISDLRYVTVSFWGFDDRPHTGELVVHAAEAAEVVGVFRRLFDARFPIEEMRLVTGADLDAPPTGDGNNTAGFVCRPKRGGSTPSAHASGLAIDVNPFQNPYSRRDLVLPELASAYLDRGHRRPGMIHPGDVVVEAFASIGWSWGGRWRSPVDRHHFSRTGT